MDLDGLLSLAEEAAFAGGKEALALWGGEVPMERSGGTYLTRADLASEKAILDVLGQGPGGAGFLSEEKGGMPHAPGRPCWIVDPIDGTWNYLHGGSWWSISIALMIEDRLVLGVVHSPKLGRTYMVHEGKDRSVCNGRDLRPDPSRFPGEWTIAFGAPLTDIGRTGDMERMLFSNIPTSDPDRPMRPSRFLPGRGSMALELCSLADGRLNALCRFGQRSWDVAAGSIIAQRSGCVLSTAEGADWAEEVRTFSRERRTDLIGATGSENLVLLKDMMAGKVLSWPL